MNRTQVAKCLPQYSKVIEDMLRETMPYDTSTLESANDDLERLIFAPDPLTGFPSNGLQVLVDSRSSAEIREYVQKYMQEVPSEVSPQSIEEGFNTIVSRYAQYGNELDSVREQLVNQIGISDGE